MPSPTAKGFSASSLTPCLWPSLSSSPCTAPAGHKMGLNFSSERDSCAGPHRMKSLGRLAASDSSADILAKANQHVEVLWKEQLTRSGSQLSKALNAAVFGVCKVPLCLCLYRFPLTQMVFVSSIITSCRCCFRHLWKVTLPGILGFPCSQGATSPKKNWESCRPSQDHPFLHLERAS